VDNFPLFLLHHLYELVYDTSRQSWSIVAQEPT
jgi:hypothetical protein